MPVLGQFRLKLIMSTLTHRGGQLTQRHSAASKGADGGRIPVEDDDVPQIDEEEMDRDSKETRLTLMEEVLLLGLKDKEV